MRSKNIITYGIKIQILALVFFYMISALIYFLLKKEKKQTITINSAKIFNFSCKTIRSIFKDQTNVTCNETCFEIRKVLRMGNSMVQLLRAVQLSKETGIKKYYFPPGFLSLSQSFTVYDIQFDPIHPNNTFNCYQQVLWYPIRTLPRVPYEIDPKFNKQYKPFNFSNDSLVIHIRSGDIFYRRYKNSHYGQPPCQYYREVISMRNWSDITILSEDNRNPCVDILSTEIGIPFKKNEFHHDFSILLNAPNIVFSYGSFSYAVILFSKKLKSIFTFNQPSSRIPDHLNCVPSELYENKVLKKWSANKSQLRLMVDPKILCKKWEFIEKGPKNTRQNIHEYAF